MDTSQWQQEAAIAQTAAASDPAISERKNRTKNDHQNQLNCPRCNSINTKFCYYNNYSLTQPRHFCKTCRRYWTEGGSLRNIPVGGGSRKNKRSAAAAADPAATSSAEPVSNVSSSSSLSMQKNNPKFSVETAGGHDFMHEVLGLGLGFQVGAGGATDQDDQGRFLFTNLQNRGEGGGDHTQVFWNGGNW